MINIKKVDSKSKTIKRNSFYIVIKGSVHQEDKAIVNIYVPNIRNININRTEMGKIEIHLQ
jgi:hypothetical protein